MNSNSLTPVFIIGASRNGTTSLENMLGRFPEVASIEHELHHGSHEAKLYGYYKYYGDISDPDKYIDFLYHYASEDYFQLAHGDIEYHLRNKRSNFFEFFFDLIDRYCRIEQKCYWTAKLDAAFFTDSDTFCYFRKILEARYGNVKFISIQRDFSSALLSAQYMEGENYAKRRKWPLKYYYLLAYTQSWFKTYLYKPGFLEKEEVLSLSFDDFIKNQENAQDQIRRHLALPLEVELNINEGSYDINSSFTKKDRPNEMGMMDKFVVHTYLSILKSIPNLASLSHWVHSLFFRHKTPNPMHRKLLKHRFFKKQLKEEFEEQGADKLLDIFD